MNSFEQSGKGLKGLLISSVAVIGLSVGVAEGQVAGLQGVVEGGKYGVGTSLYMPFGSVSGGMPFVGVEGGLLGGKTNGAALLGYGQGFGNVGFRVYGGVGLKEGKKENLFTAANVGADIYVGGFGIGVRGSVPFGDKKTEVHGQRVEGVLLDPSGQQCDPTGVCVPLPPSCTNPEPGQIKKCVPGVAVISPSYERALKGFEAEVSYQFKVGPVVLSPSLGYYRYGKNEVAGMTGEVRIDVPLTSGLSLNVVGGGRRGFRGEESGTSGYAGLGISYNFGSTPASQLSSLERRFAQAPNRNQRSVVTAITKEETHIYRNSQDSQVSSTLGLAPPRVGIVWKMNPRQRYISDIYVVDSANEKNLDDIVASAPDDAIVVVDGNVVIDETLEIKNDGVGIAGAGNALAVRVTSDGGMTYTDAVLPLFGKGLHAKIDGGALSAVIEAENVDSPILYGLDVKGGKAGVAFNNVNKGVIANTTVHSNANTGIKLAQTTGVVVSDSQVRNVKNGIMLDGGNQLGLFERNLLSNMENGVLISATDEDLLFKDLTIQESSKRAFYSDGQIIGVDGFYFKNTGGVVLSDLSANNSLKNGKISGYESDDLTHKAFIESSGYGNWLRYTKVDINHDLFSGLTSTIRLNGALLGGLSDVTVTSSGTLAKNYNDIELVGTEDVALNRIKITADPGLVVNPGTLNTQIWIENSWRALVDYTDFNLRNYQQGIHVVKSKAVSLDDININMTQPASGISILESEGVYLENTRILSDADPTNGEAAAISIVQSKKVELDFFYITGSFTNSAIHISRSSSVIVDGDGGMIQNLGDGITIDDSQNVLVKALAIYQREDSGWGEYRPRGIVISSSSDATRSTVNLDHIVIQQFVRSLISSRGVVVNGHAALMTAAVVSLKEVSVESIASRGFRGFTIGFEFGKNVIVVDNGFNSASGTGFDLVGSSVCDGVADAVGSIDVLYKGVKVLCQ